VIVVEGCPAISPLHQSPRGDPPRTICSTCPPTSGRDGGPTIHRRCTPDHVDNDRTPHTTFLRKDDRERIRGCRGPPHRIRTTRDRHYGCRRSSRDMGTIPHHVLYNSITGWTFPKGRCRGSFHDVVRDGGYADRSGIDSLLVRFRSWSSHMIHDCMDI